MRSKGCLVQGQRVVELRGAVLVQKVVELDIFEFQFLGDSSRLLVAGKNCGLLNDRGPAAVLSEKFFCGLRADELPYDYATGTAPETDPLLIVAPDPLGLEVGRGDSGPRVRPSSAKIRDPNSPPL